MLLSADGLSTHAIMREAGVSKTAVRRWQERFAREGINGLLKDRTGPARIPPLDDVTGAPNTGPLEVGWSSLRVMVSEVNGIRFGPAPSIIEERP